MYYAGVSASNRFEAPMRIIMIGERYAAACRAEALDSRLLVADLRSRHTRDLRDPYPYSACS